MLLAEPDNPNSPIPSMAAQAALRTEAERQPLSCRMARFLSSSEISSQGSESGAHALKAVFIPTFSARVYCDGRVKSSQHHPLCASSTRREVLCALRIELSWVSSLRTLEACRSLTQSPKTLSVSYKHFIITLPSGRISYKRTILPPRYPLAHA